MMRAESGLVQTPIVFGSVTVFSVISARIPPNNDTIIIIAAKESAVFKDKPVMVFAFLDMSIYKNNLTTFLNVNLMHWSCQAIFRTGFNVIDLKLILDKSKK